MKPLALAAACLLAALSARAANDDQQGCPEGTVRVATNRVNEPFKCVRQMDPATPFINMRPTFKLRECPRGSHPVETPGLGSGRRYRCVMDGPGEMADPSADPALPGSVAPARAPAAGISPDAGRGGAPPRADAPSAPVSFTRYTVRTQFQVDFPKGWHVHDGWQDEVPTFYSELDTGRNGKQLQLVVSRVSRGQEGWVDLATAVSRDKEWQNADEAKPSRVAGFPARETFVAKSSRTTYVAYADDGYFTLSYSAPDDLFDLYLPAYRRMVTSFKVSKSGLK